MVSFEFRGLQMLFMTRATVAATVLVPTLTYMAYIFVYYIYISTVAPLFGIPRTT